MRKQAPFIATLGFTLVELLVGLTLMALLSVILFGGLRFGVRAWEAGGEHVDRATRIEAVQALLRRQVGQARAPILPEADAGPVAAFVGGPDSLRFVAPLPAHRGAGGSYLFYLALRERGELSDLTLAWRLFRPEQPADDLAAPEEATMLLEGIAGIDLAYYGAADPEQPLQWWEAWDGAGGRPRLVRLRVEFPPGDPRRWPDLIIRVLGSAN